MNLILPRSPGTGFTAARDVTDETQTLLVSKDGEAGVTKAAGDAVVDIEDEELIIGAEGGAVQGQTETGSLKGQAADERSSSSGSVGEVAVVQRTSETGSRRKLGKSTVDVEAPALVTDSSSSV